MYTPPPAPKDVQKAAFCRWWYACDYSIWLFVFFLRSSPPLPSPTHTLFLSPAGVHDCCCFPDQDNLLSQLEPPVDSSLPLSLPPSSLSLSAEGNRY